MAKPSELHEAWAKSVTPDTDEFTAAQLSGERPYGMPAESVGTLTDHDGFEQVMLGRGVSVEHLNTEIKQPGSNEITLPRGFAHMQEVLGQIVSDQTSINPLARHTRMTFTFRQNTFPSEQKSRDVHVDPCRNQDAVAEDYIYLVSNADCSIVQDEPVIDPKETLNGERTPEELIEAGLMRQAEPYEVVRGTEFTYHVESAFHGEGRTLVRIIISHPDAEYFHGLSDAEKTELPPEFLQKHGIQISDSQIIPA